jgi:hypothetical protein
MGSFAVFSKKKEYLEKALSSSLKDIVSEARLKMN